MSIATSAMQYAIKNIKYIKIRLINLSNLQRVEKSIFINDKI